MKRALLLPLLFAAVLALVSAGYTISETEQVIITQFGQQVGEPITTAGLHWKTPFIQTVQRIEKDRKSVV